MVRRRHPVHRMSHAETRRCAERAGRKGVPMAGTSGEPRKRGHSRNTQAQIQNGKKKSTGRTAFYDIVSGKRARGTTDGEHGDFNDVAERKWTKSHNTERRPESESTKEATEVQRKDRDPMYHPRTMGPEETRRTSETEHSGK